MLIQQLVSVLMSSAYREGEGPHPYVTVCLYSGSRLEKIALGTICRIFSLFFVLLRGLVFLRSKARPELHLEKKCLSHKCSFHDTSRHNIYDMWQTSSQTFQTRALLNPSTIQALLIQIG